MCPLSLSTLYFELALNWTWRSTLLLDLLASRPPGSVCLSPQCWRHAHILCLYSGAGDLNSGPQAYSASSTLLTERPPSFPVLSVLSSLMALNLVWSWRLTSNSSVPCLHLLWVEISGDAVISSFQFLKTCNFGISNFLSFLRLHSLRETGLRFLILLPQPPSVRILGTGCHIQHILSALRSFPVKTDQGFLQITINGRYFKEKYFCLPIYKSNGARETIFPYFLERTHK